MIEALPKELAVDWRRDSRHRWASPDFSLRRYRELLDPVRSAQIHVAALNSVWVAGLATAIGAVFSVLAALAIARVARPSAKLLEASFLSPLILPTLCYGSAALMFFSVVGIRPSLTLLIAGQFPNFTTFQDPETGHDL